MPKNKPAKDVLIEPISSEIFKGNIDELVLEVLLKKYPKYLTALDQSGVALDKIIFIEEDYDLSQEALCLCRYFDINGSLRGVIKVVLSDDHINEAVLLAEKVRAKKSLPPPKRVNREVIW